MVQSCVSMYFFFLFSVELQMDHRETCQKTYTLSPTSMKWSDALAYCRKHYKDMAMIENDQENTRMLSVTLNLDVWIGLYRVSWRWSDNSTSWFRNWAYGEPDNRNIEHCAAEGTNHLWADIPCSRKLPFWCQEGEKEIQIF
uniref:C-type lectin domain-containing protein n=1 Tax=Amphiprion percula TaxID=161767 RepID=A0A3P8TYQ5_AMPPE